MIYFNGYVEITVIFAPVTDKSQDQHFIDEHRITQLNTFEKISSRIISKNFERISIIIQFKNSLTFIAPRKLVKILFTVIHTGLKHKNISSVTYKLSVCTKILYIEMKSIFL